MSEPRPNRPRRRILRGVLLALACVVVLFIALDFDWSGSAPPARTRRLRYDDVAWDVVEPEFLRSKGLDVDDIPDEENAALDYLAASRRLPDGPASWPAEAKKVLDHEREYALRYTWPDDPSLLWSYVGSCAPMLDCVLAGIEKDRLAWYWIGGRDGSLASCFPICPPAGGLAKAAVVTGRSFKAEGDDREVAAHYLIAVAMGNDAAQAGDSSSVLFGCGAIGVGLDALDRWVLEAPPQDELEWCLRILRRFEADKPDFAGVVRFERAVALDCTLAYGKSRPQSVRALLAGGGPIFGRSRTLRAAARRNVNALYDEMGAWTSPHGRARFGRPLDWDRLWDGAEQDWLIGMAVRRSSSLARAHHYVEIAALRYLATEVRIGLAFYKAGHGEYPDALDKIEPYLDEIPLDPFSDKPFCYRREGSEYVLYSIGPNMKDDGGRDLREDPTRLYGRGADLESWIDQDDLVFTSRLAPPPPLAEFVERKGARPKEGWSTEQSGTGE
ncbi:MAG: hypothetical protein JW889_14645 [Verrucomicrobia bacterium]|nr:hypothetical protein [Verrucomicrobiota bacterium]